MDRERETHGGMPKHFMSPQLTQLEAVGQASRKHAAATKDEAMVLAKEMAGS